MRQTRAGYCHSQEQRCKKAGLVWEESLFDGQPTTSYFKPASIAKEIRFNILEPMSKLKDSLPQESRQEFVAILEEGKMVARGSLQTALDAANLAARTKASAVLMRWSSWLQSLGLSHNIQQSMQDRPSRTHRCSQNRLTLGCMALKLLGLLCTPWVCIHPWPLGITLGLSSHQGFQARSGMNSTERVTDAIRANLPSRRPSRT